MLADAIVRTVEAAGFLVRVDGCAIIAAAIEGSERYEVTGETVEAAAVQLAVVMFDVEE